ncbi:uncharacterized protein LOC144103673 [Amblyomma americanum]
MQSLRLADEKKIAPYIDLEEFGHGTEVSGPLAPVLEGFARKFGLRTQILYPQERIWGIKTKNNFTGFLGMVQRGEVYIMPGPMAPTVGRAEAADFTVPYDVNYVSLMTWKPGTFVDPFNFVVAFDKEVWLGILLSWILLSLVTAVLDSPACSISKGKLNSFAGFMWLYFMHLFPCKLPIRTSLWFRLLLGTWLTVLLVIMGLLSSTLTSTMAIRKTADYVNSFEDLLRFPKVTITAEKLTYFSRLFKHPVGETFRKLSGREKEVVGLYHSGPVLSWLMDEVLQKKRVLVAPDVTFKSHIADVFATTGSCQHHVSEGNGGMIHIVMAIRKTLPKDFKRKLNKYITTVNECNVYHKEMEWRLRNYALCKNLKDDAVKPLVLLDLQGAFLLLLGGTGIVPYVHYDEFSNGTIITGPLGAVVEALVRHFGLSTHMTRVWLLGTKTMRLHYHMFNMIESKSSQGSTIT